MLSDHLYNSSSSSEHTIKSTLETSNGWFLTIITLMFRITTPEGNMNPQMGEVDIVPDDDLNTRLKFYVSDFKLDKFLLF